MRKTAVALSLLLLAGCGDTPFTPEGVEGVYALVSTDGVAVPNQDVTSGSLSLQAAGTYTVAFDESTGVGTFTLVEPNTIQFTSGGQDIFDDFTGTLNGNEITVTGDVDVVSVGIAGQGSREVQVTDGEAQFTLPASADPGTVVLISDNKVPTPSSASVTVVGGN